jgi:phosphate-selective porin OprO/OprP
LFAVITKKEPMKKFLIALFSLVTLSGFSQKFDTKWETATTLQSDDDKFKISSGGRIYYDIAYFNQDKAIEDSLGSKNFGSEFRKVQLYFGGKIYGNIKYKAQLDFGGGKVAFKDVWIEFTKIPLLGNLKLGHFKEPMRLEALTSSKYGLAMERSFVSGIMEERNTGAMIFNEFLNKKLGIQLATMFNADKWGNDKNNDGYMNIDGRIVFLPVNNETSTIHLGTYYSYRANKNKTYGWELKPDAHMGLHYIDFNMNAENMNVYGGEFATTWKPFTFWAEYINQAVNGVDNDYNFGAYTFYIGYFITGEHRKYKNTASGFNRIHPKKNLGDGGYGAFEVVARYSSVNLNDKDANGGQMNDITLGINWYLNPSCKLVFNYVHSQRIGIGNANIFEMRTQIDF